MRAPPINRAAFCLCCVVWLGAAHACALGLLKNAASPVPTPVNPNGFPQNALRDPPVDCSGGFAAVPSADVFGRQKLVVIFHVVTPYRGSDVHICRQFP